MSCPPRRRPRQLAESVASGILHHPAPASRRRGRHDELDLAYCEPLADCEHPSVGDLQVVMDKTLTAASRGQAASPGIHSLPTRWLADCGGIRHPLIVIGIAAGFALCMTIAGRP